MMTSSTSAVSSFVAELSEAKALKPRSPNLMPMDFFAAVITTERKVGLEYRWRASGGVAKHGKRKKRNLYFLT